MQPKLFLQGPFGSGKTALLSSVLHDQLSFAGGFLTRKSYSGEDPCTGFELTAAGALVSPYAYEAQRFLDFRSFPPIHNTEVFRGYGVRLLKEAAYYPFVLLDGIGGFELIVPQFREELYSLLGSPVPCVGTLMTEQDSLGIGRLLGLGPHYDDAVHCFYATLASIPEVEILRLPELSAESAEKTLRLWCHQYLS